MEFNFEIHSKKRKCDQEEEDQPRKGIDCLPRELSLDIISRLPITSLIQFRFVCKAWNVLSHDPNLVNIHLSNVLKGNRYLIFHCDLPIKNVLYFVEFSGDMEKVRKFETPFSTSLPEFNVVGSCNGILCLVNSLFDGAIYVYNPFTRNYIELPRPSTFQVQLVMYGFGFHPIANQYKVIRIAYYANSKNVNTTVPARRLKFHKNCCSDVQIFCLGSRRWRSIGRVPYQLDRRSTAVLLDGRIHWTTNFGNYHGRRDKLIVSFDLSDELFREVPGPELATRLLRNYHLATLGGCLCIAVPVPGNLGSLDIWIMKEYNRKESWVKEFRIGSYFRNMIPKLRRAQSIWRNVLSRRTVRVLCLLKNGDILLEYREGTLVSYNPESGKFKRISFPGMPELFQTVVHVGSLNWIDASS